MYSSCPEKTVKIDGVCVPCKCENCLVCKVDLVTCEKCATPTLILDGKCKAECPIGYYSTGFSCEKCELNCDKCNSSTECKKCNDTTFLFNEDCLNLCPDFTYGDLLDRTCKNCNDSERCLKLGKISPWLKLD